MTARPLRKNLSLQAVLACLLPFAVMAVLVAAWLFPLILADIESHQKQLAVAIGKQIESHFAKAMDLAQTIADVQKDLNPAPHALMTLFDKRLAASGSLKIAYVAEAAGWVTAVCLADKNEARRQDLLGIDLSGAPLFRQVVLHQRPLWSETFLSALEGQLSVAVGVPSGEKVVVGEIDLGLLTRYLKQIALFEEQLIFILDHRGQVVADQDGRHAAEQLNLSNLELVRTGLESAEPVIGRFTFEGQSMIVCMVRTSLINWHALVLLPEKEAFEQLRITTAIFVTALLVTALAAIGGAVFASLRLARRFESIAAHARRVKDGDHEIQWPVFSILEFNQLTDDLKQMAETIQDREAYNRILFTDSPFALIVLDSVSNRCVDANQAALELFDLRGIDALYGKSLADLSAPAGQNENKTAAGLNTRVAACLEKGAASFEWVFKKSDNRVWDAQVGLSRFTYDGKRYVHANFRDISRLKQEQAEKEKLQTQFQQAQKLESVGRLAGGVAHDLNNLLTPILGYGELLIQDLPPDDPRKAALEQIVQAGRRARDIVGQLLAFSRKQTISLQVVDLNEVIARFHVLLRRTIREDIAITLAVSPTPSVIRGDAGQLEQVLMNLAVNAQDAMPSGGQLTIETAMTQLNGDYAAVHSDVTPGPHVMLAVSDTGHGMDEKTRKHIFEPFFTTKDSDKGTGLGLAMVYGIVKQHGGHVWVYSEPQKGTTFKIYLPVCDQRCAISETTDQKTQTLHGKETILLVEDDDQVRHMTFNILTRHGYDVCLADSGEDALNTVKNRTEQIHLLLTDVVMPGMNGKELFEAIALRYPGIKALFMSGYTDEVIARRGIMDEGVHFIQKPFSVESLAIKVREVLDH